MGIYERDYYGGDRRRGIDLGGPRSMVVNLILVNVAVYVVLSLIQEIPNGPIYTQLRLPANLFDHPWTIWQLLTYGFLHVSQPTHIVFNMFGLYIFGRDVETVYGRKVFLWMYLTAIVFSGLVWLASTNAAYYGEKASVVGASGAVTAVVMLFVLHFPRRIILLFFVLPVPAWVLGVMFIVFDAFGFMTQGDSNVAFAAHLGGGLYGFIFFKSGWSIGRLIPSGMNFKKLGPRPKLRLHDPDERERKLESQVDEILAKISREGEASLTARERRTLEEASRRAQKRRSGSP